MFSEVEGVYIFGVVEGVCRVQKGLRSEDLCMHFIPFYFLPCFI